MAKLIPQVRPCAGGRASQEEEEENAHQEEEEENAQLLAQVRTIIRTIGVDKIRSYLRFQMVYSCKPFARANFENCVSTNSWDVQNTIAKMGKRVVLDVCDGREMSIRAERNMMSICLCMCCQGGAAVGICSCRPCDGVSLLFQVWQM